MSKSDNRSEAEAMIAAFLEKGGAITKGPKVEATTFACASCGHTGISGFKPGTTPKCPKCRAVLGK